MKTRLLALTLAMAAGCGASGGGDLGEEPGSGGAEGEGGRPGSGGKSGGRGGQTGGGGSEAAGGITGTGGATAAGGTPAAGGSSPRDAGVDRAATPDAPPSTGGEPVVAIHDSPCLGTPDPDVAAGPTLFATAIQWDAYFFAKDTGKLDHKYTWKALRGGLVSDTHIVWDVTSKHWFMTTIVDLGGGRFGVQLMVSTDETASAWKLSIPIEMPRLIDDPQPTVTSDKVVITESGKCVWAVDKTALIAGNAATVQAITCNLAQNNQVAAVKFGGTPPTNGYAITMSDSTHINWIEVTGTPAAADLKATEHKVLVPRVDEVPLDGITQGGMRGLESGQVKAMWQGGHIVWNKTVRCPAGTCVRSFDVDTATNTVKSDDFTIAETQLFYGASGFDKAGNMWLLTSAAKPAGFVGLALGRRSPTGAITPSKVIVEGLAAIPGGGGLIRFGDYVSAAQDPVDGSTWLIGQYAARAKGPLNGENNAGCKVVHVTAP